MKRFALYTLLSSAAFLTSCGKQLEQVPSSSRAEDQSIETVSDLKLAVNGVYAALNNQFGYSGETALYADAKGGDIKAISTGNNQTLTLHTFRTDKNSSISDGAYQVFSTVSGRVNNILKYAPSIAESAPQADKARAKDYVGQLYALRGLAHLELARLYCYIPSSGVNVDAKYSGIPIINQVFPRSHQFQRSTLRETYDFVISDLTKALETLSKEKIANSGNLNYWATAGLLSRAYLYNGDWQNAYKYASEVISSSGYKLYTPEEYLTVWSKTGTSESLFEVLTTDKDNAGLNSIGSYTNPSGYAEFGTSESFLSWLRANRADDIRTQSITERANADGGNKGYYTIKYPGQAGASSPTGVNNFKVIRLSELYLIAAEALLKGATASDGKTALDYYNALRSQRFTSYTAATTVTLEDILSERRIELFCEGHRLFDLVRNKKNITSEYIPIGNELNYLDAQLLIDLPEREKNISKDLVLRAAK